MGASRVRMWRQLRKRWKASELGRNSAKPSHFGRDAYRRRFSERVRRQDPWHFRASELRSLQSMNPLRTWVGGDPQNVWFDSRCSRNPLPVFFCFFFSSFFWGRADLRGLDLSLRSRQLVNPLQTFGGGLSQGQPRKTWCFVWCARFSCS